MFQLENELLKIAVHPKGAELRSIFSKKSQIEHLWNGDPAYWAKHSPILFPIVGTLKNDRYHFNGHTYHMTRHGFARDKEFTVSKQTISSITFKLESDADTLQKYPFAFELYVQYTLDENKLKVQYRVYNPSNKAMYFSIGGHPAFAVPFEAGTSYEDYYIQFSHEENAGRWPISPNGLIEAMPLPFFGYTDTINLTHELFEKDAIVLKYLQSHHLKLASRKSSHGMIFNFEGFPFLGLWSSKNASFLCIEPWCGIADSVASDQELIHKEGINLLTPKQDFQREWKVEFF